METYYNFPVPIRLPMFAALDLRYINNPGYTGPETSSAPRASDCILSCERTPT